MKNLEKDEAVRIADAKLRKLKADLEGGVIQARRFLAELRKVK